MGKARLVHKLERFGELPGNLLDLGVFERPVHVLSEVALAHVLHGDANRRVRLVPSKRLDKAVKVLQRVSKASHCSAGATLTLPRENLAAASSSRV